MHWIHLEFAMRFRAQKFREWVIKRRKFKFEEINHTFLKTKLGGWEERDFEFKKWKLCTLKVAWRIWALTTMNNFSWLNSSVKIRSWVISRSFNWDGVLSCYKEIS